VSDNDYGKYDRDVSQRILHSETRIKNWVIGGVLANLVILIGIGAPMVWYLGQLSAQVGVIAQLDGEVKKLRSDVDQLQYVQGYEESK
jgi:hypothetical protein